MSTLFLAAVVGLFASPAFAQDDAASDGAAAEIDIPMTETYVTGTPGDIVQIGSTAVDAAVQDHSCEVVATITNQSSVHVGNTLVVTSGESSVTMTNIEDAADTTVTGGGTITLGETITAAVVLGADGATSLGAGISLACAILPVSPVAPAVPATPDPATPIAPAVPATPDPATPIAPAVPATPDPATPIAPAVPATPVQATPTYTG
jgi:hypothetical protein